MQNKDSIEGLLIVLTGCIIISCSFYIFLIANTIYPTSHSSRVQNLNWLLSSFGKTGTAILVSIPGIIAIYWGAKKMGKK
jgi:uncharacterized membrane-anchored protein YitT (DUF2179 family)